MVWHGCAHSGGLYPDRSVEQDYFTYGAELVRDLGFPTLKFYLSAGFSGRDYVNQAFPGTPTTLVELAQETCIANILADVNIERYVISVFALQEPDMSWKQDPGMSPLNFQREYDEVYDLCVHLLTTYPGKEFILKNWEGDWQLMGGAGQLSANVPPERLWQYRAYHGRRQQAVSDARRDVTSTAKISYAIECNRVLDDYGLRVHRDVLPYVTVDMVSLSIYEAINAVWPSTFAWQAKDAFFGGGETITSAATDGTIYVIAGHGGKISSSVDGHTWTARTSQFGADNIYGLAWCADNQLFIAVGAAGKISTSTDGVTWVARTSGVATDFNGVLTTPGSGALYVYGENSEIYWSLDGISWGSVSFLAPGKPAGVSWKCGAYDPNGANHFVIAGSDGKLVYGSGPVCISVTSQFGADTIRSVAQVVTGGGFVAVGDAGKCSSSNFDGSVWTARTSQFGADRINKVLNADGLWVAVGQAGKISTSTDGQTWTAQTSGSVAELTALAHSGSEDVWAVGTDGGNVLASTLGINWKSYNGDAFSQRINAILASDGLHVLVANDARVSVSNSLSAQKPVEDSIEELLTEVYNRVRRYAGPDVPIFIGEFGWPQDEPAFDGLDVGRLIQKVIDIADSLGIIGAIWWQILDNEELSPGVPRGFGLYERNGGSNVVGARNAAGDKYAAIL
jgi:hypothetical protein